MKKQIRNGVFETNSSSIHSLCITKKEDYKFPKTIVFNSGRYGWGPETEYNTGNYLYTALLELKDQIPDGLDQLKEILKKHGIEVIFNDPGKDYYIDHAYDVQDAIESLLNDEDKLFRFLFGNESFVDIDNDNHDWDEDDVFYRSGTYEVLYK